MYSSLDWKTLLKKIRENKDKLAKEELLKRYLDQGCKWAKQQLKKAVYTDLIDPEEGEIMSITYQAFERAIKHFDLSETKKVMSFKNFFFLMIKFQIFSDLKHVLNYKVVSGFSEERKILKEYLKSYESDDLEKQDSKYKLEKVIEFLRSKNEEYASIIELRRDGFTNDEICKKLGLSWIGLKGRLQYIKKLSLLQFGSVDDIS